MMRLEVCKDSEIGVGETRKLEVSPPIAVIRGESGELFAIDDTCSHAEASLSEGFVEGDQIECPLHMAMFCLKTGKACSPPASKPVATHKIVIEDGTVFVDVER